MTLITMAEIWSGAGYTCLLGTLYIISIAFHEFGHALAYREITKHWPEFKFNIRKTIGIDFTIGNKEELEKLTDKEYRGVVIAGIFWGLIPIIASIGIVGFLVMIILLVVYYLGCRHDIKILKEKQ